MSSGDKPFYLATQVSCVIIRSENKRNQACYAVAPLMGDPSCVPKTPSPVLIRCRIPKVHKREKNKEKENAPSTSPFVLPSRPLL